MLYNLKQTNKIIYLYIKKLYKIIKPIIVSKFHVTDSNFGENNLKFCIIKSHFLDNNPNFHISCGLVLLFQLMIVCLLINRLCIYKRVKDGYFH